MCTPPRSIFRSATWLKKTFRPSFIFKAASHQKSATFGQRPEFVLPWLRSHATHTIFGEETSATGIKTAILNNLFFLFLYTNSLHFKAVDNIYRVIQNDTEDGTDGRICATSVSKETVIKRKSSVNCAYLAASPCLKPSKYFLGGPWGFRQKRKFIFFYGFLCLFVVRRLVAGSSTASFPGRRLKSALRAQTSGQNDSLLSLDSRAVFARFV